MYEVGKFIPNMVRNFDSSFFFVDISSAQHKCHAEHFPLRFITKKVTRQYSNEVNSDFKQRPPCGEQERGSLSPEEEILH